MREESKTGRNAVRTFSFPNAYFLRGIVVSFIIFICLIILISITPGGFFETPYPSILVIIYAIAVFLEFAYPMFFGSIKACKDHLFLKMGLLLTEKIPYSDIRSVERWEGKVRRSGVYPSLTKDRIFVLGNDTGLVRLDMTKRRFPGALFKKTGTMIISLDNPDIFVNFINEKIGR